MTKKCLGCGVTLQDSDSSKDGYVRNLEMDYCERCFKIKNYNANINSNLKMDNETLVKKINENGSFVFFICDFLNICSEVIDLYNKINNSKVFILSKSDIIPKNIIIKDLIDNLKKEYNLNDIIYCSSKTNTVGVIKKLMEENKKCLFVGPTNAGKSSLINKLTNESITVSSNSNTTMDFMGFKYNDITIYDSPGFNLSLFIETKTSKNKINAVTYQLSNKYNLQFLDIELGFNKDNNITLYFNNIYKVSKRRKLEDKSYDIIIPRNSDLIIKGLGFINIKKECKANININPGLIEVRKSIIGK